MIICVCNNVNSETIENAIALGASVVDDVRETTGAASSCGKCQFKVNRILQESIQMDIQKQGSACL